MFVWKISRNAHFKGKKRIIPNTYIHEIDEKFCVKSKHTVYRLLSHWHLSNIVQTTNKETIWILFSGIDIRDARIWEKFWTDRECVAYAWGSKSRATAEKLDVCSHRYYMWNSHREYVQCLIFNTMPFHTINHSFYYGDYSQHEVWCFIVLFICLIRVCLFFFSFGLKKISGRLEAINTQMTSYAAGLHCLGTHVTEHSSKQFEKKK